MQRDAAQDGFNKHEVTNDMPRTCTTCAQNTPDGVLAILRDALPGETIAISELGQDYWHVTTYAVGDTLVKARINANSTYGGCTSHTLAIETASYRYVGRERMPQIGTKPFATRVQERIALLRKWYAAEPEREAARQRETEDKLRTERNRAEMNSVRTAVRAELRHKVEVTPGSRSVSVNFQWIRKEQAEKLIALYAKMTATN